MIDLVKLARDSIKSYFNKEKVEFPKDSPKRGVFVTLYKGEELRGCIGYPEPIMQLNEAVFQAAKGAAFEDSRFSLLKEEELKDIRIEVSVLTPPELIEVKSSEEYLDNINVGEDGLVIRSQLGSGLLLPQVATEYGWSAEEFLQQTCIKAGLSVDDWKEGGVEVFKFQAKVYKENS